MRLFRKTGYEKLPQLRDRHHHGQGMSRGRVPLEKTVLCKAAVAVAVLVAMTLFSSHPSSSNSWSARQSSISHETVPTLLSLVHPSTGELLSALDHDVYERLSGSTLDHQPSSHTGWWWFHWLWSTPKTIIVAPKLSLDLDRVHYHSEALTLSWTPGVDSRGHAVVDKSTLILLTCGQNETLESTPLASRVVLEGATVEEALATSSRQFADPTTAPPNAWYMPNFPIVRHEACQFVLIENHGDHFTWLASSNVFETASMNQPTSVHLAVGDSASSMVVDFITGASGTPIVELIGGGGSITTYQGTSSTYTADDLCGAPANIEAPGKFQPPGQLHSVVMDHLAPSTRYQYRVGLKGGQGVTWSDTFAFSSTPVVGDRTPFRYIVYGDQGCPSKGWGQGGTWVAAMVEREISNASVPARMVHHFGDLSYAQGAAHIWDEWMTMIEPVARSVPYMIGVGNHEYDHLSGGANKDPSGVESDAGYHPAWGNFGDDSYGECGVPTAKRFHMPQSNTSNGVFWYSYDYAMVHTVMLSSEHDLSLGSPQHAWLAEDLAAVNRTTTPWIIVELHRPLYEGEAIWYQNSVGIGLRFAVEDLLFDYRVDLVLAGHYHAYHRTCDGLYRSRCDNGGPTHITVGSAGAKLDEAWLYRNGWSAEFIRGEYGYGRITVANATALHFEFVRAGDQDDPEAGKVHDDVWIRRHRG